ncbi:MAG TPA: hypothetical protein VGI29_00460 [Candidatus Binataceae bacterium]
MIAIEPLGATVCIRAARLVVCPIGVYSTLPPPVEIDRTTTSPELTPTRISSGARPAASSLSP